MIVTGEGNKPEKGIKDKRKRSFNFKYGTKGVTCPKEAVIQAFRSMKELAIPVSVTQSTPIREQSKSLAVFLA